jgi:hypothetical protein
MFLEMMKRPVWQGRDGKRFVCKNLETYLAFEEKGKALL